MGIVEPLFGSVKYGFNVKVGYFDQQVATKVSDKTILEDYMDTYPFLTNQEARKDLGAFMFSGCDVDKKMNILSGGEVVRLVLCKILKMKPNFLILDEPTNDLDIITLNILEEYLQSFKGCLLIVSHDRYFLDKTAGHLFIFREGGHIKDFVGTYSEYREYIREQEAEEALQAEIPQLEAEKSTLETQLSAGTLSHEELSAAATRIGEIISTLEEKEMRWLELSDI